MATDPDIDNPEREKILTEALEAKTPQEVELATQQLRQWVKTHPDDPGIVDAFEPLALRRMAFAEQDALSMSDQAVAR